MGLKSIFPEVLDEETLTRPIHECLSPYLTTALSQISHDVRSQTLADLEECLSITPLMRQIKISFWEEYRRTIVQSKPTMSVSAVCDQICSREHFYHQLVRREESLAWLFHPPTAFDKIAEEALEFGIERLRKEILTAPLYSQNGAFNEKNAAVILNAIKFLDARVKGSPLQRIEQKSLHVHKTIESGSITKEDLDKELAQLRAQLASASQPLLVSAPDETE